MLNFIEIRQKHTLLFITDIYDLEKVNKYEQQYKLVVQIINFLKIHSLINNLRKHRNRFYSAPTLFLYYFMDG